MVNLFIPFTPETFKVLIGAYLALAIWAAYICKRNPYAIMMAAIVLVTPAVYLSIGRDTIGVEALNVLGVTFVMVGGYIMMYAVHIVKVPDRPTITMSFSTYFIGALYTCIGSMVMVAHVESVWDAGVTMASIGFLMGVITRACLKIWDDFYQYNQRKKEG